MRLRASLLALAVLPTLSGCVAAALIPVAAGGAIAGRETGLLDVGSSTRSAPKTERPRTADKVGLDETVPETRIPAVAPGGAGASDARPAMAQPVGGRADYAVLDTYLAAQTRTGPGEERLSATLADPGSMGTERADCASRPPAVLVDLDPAGEPLRMDRPLGGDGALADVLTHARDRGADIAWISRLGAGFAGELRTALEESGLDPAGTDTLLLMRRPGDSKQARREELAASHCTVAILGDTRSDFDQLFDYLKDPNAAHALDPLLGRGWFLVPPPLQPQKD
ncbi:hypothetical protein MKP08_02065 [Erythrobacter sp. LQ02-29]|uniref:hypothetical protein n=1 Tax=Erythrobacter sp. LQ02-29 TaxID=2920384 RepID=UPI001F4D9F7E|nr:hypothetical protein [Erythrobacter sp. LQ02-29]MCP9221534.1 hypothetical protein [Erythrobacter sp. LQ02-29]